MKRVVIEPNRFKDSIENQVYNKLENSVSYFLRSSIFHLIVNRIELIELKFLLKRGGSYLC